MAEKIVFEDGRISNFESARDLDLGFDHTAYPRASLIDLYLRDKFGRTDVHTDIRDRLY